MLRTMTFSTDSRTPSRGTLAAIVFAALAGAAGVTLGALAAHGLDATAAGRAETAARYALVHAPAMIGAGLWRDRLEAGAARLLAGGALVAFAAGIVMFSGGLAALAFGVNTHSAPFGGMALIVGWLMLALAALAGFAGRKS
jgi:uncharacterized membrane protein YgdD (TMEM256/DUF423 family)